MGEAKVWVQPQPGSHVTLVSIAVGVVVHHARSSAKTRGPQGRFWWTRSGSRPDDALEVGGLTF
eukprot:1568189-Heterocapsa_arctica.AAC.1